MSVAQLSSTSSSPASVSSSVSVSGTGEPPAGALPWIEDPGSVAPKDARTLSRLFFDQLQVLEEGTSEHQYARNTLIEMNLSLVRFAARRFRNLGSGEMEDVIQVGTIGLIKAIDRFDLSREVEFSSFAIPYITGEIKRFFRDTTWAVHVPRRLQELSGDITRARDELNSRLGRNPTAHELATHLNLPQDEVTEGLLAVAGYTAGSLDTPADDGQSSGELTFAHVFGEHDPRMGLVEDLHSLAPLIRRLDERERRIIEMRFGQDMTQSQIGSALGVSQMQVSRLLTRTLTKLRTGLLTEN